MKAICYAGMKNVEVRQVDDPKIENDDDIVVRVTSTSLCGSDLHKVMRHGNHRKTLDLTARGRVI